MSSLAWTLCGAWITGAVVVATASARRGAAEGRARRAVARLKSPTVYLFTAYLMVAAIAAPHEASESTSPILGLAIVLPLGYALATLSAIGAERPSAARRASLAVLHGGAVMAGAAVVLAIASPAYLPAVLR